FPVGRLSVITGISGSGKSTLMHDVIWPAVRDHLEERKRAGNGDLFKLVSGAQEIEAVYEVDQSPIGKTSRSTPGTYVKVFDDIRRIGSIFFGASENCAPAFAAGRYRAQLSQAWATESHAQRRRSAAPQAGNAIETRGRPRGRRADSKNAQAGIDIVFAGGTHH